MPVFAVTRAGQGRVFEFKTVLLADQHPLVQYGDPIISKSSELRSCLTMLECAKLADQIGNGNLAKDIRSCAKDNKFAVTRLMSDLWESFVQAKLAPPSDPEEVLRIIVADRIATRRTGVVMRPRGEFEMSENEINEANAGNETEAAAAAATEKKNRPIPKDPKYAGTSIISLNKDSEGKQYGADHNPKKPGSASHERFAKYVDGMTVAAAKEAGLLNGDLDNDVKKGFISIA